MKIKNWRRKLAATLVAGGLLSPSAAHAAGVGVNLVVNGTFENVDLAVVGYYNSPKVLNWTGPNLYAYSHDGSSSSAGVVPDYADGADPPGAGHWYFTPNNGGAAILDVHDPNVYYQDIDVSTGASATKIASGTAKYSLSAYMSSYLNDGDYGHVQVEFRNAASTVLSTNEINDLPDSGVNNVWNLTSTTGTIPVGTASVRMSLFGTKVGGAVGGGADGYTDNIDFRIQIPEPSSALLASVCLAAAGLGLRRRETEG